MYVYVCVYVCARTHVHPSIICSQETGCSSKLLKLILNSNYTLIHSIYSSVKIYIYIFLKRDKYGQKIVPSSLTLGRNFWHLQPSIPSAKLIPMILHVALTKPKSIVHPMLLHLVFGSSRWSGNNTETRQGKKGRLGKGTRCVLLHLFPFDTFSFPFSSLPPDRFPKTKEYKAANTFTTHWRLRLNSKGCII